MNQIFHKIRKWHIPLRWNVMFAVFLMGTIFYLRYDMERTSSDDSFFLLKNVLLRLSMMAILVVIIFSLMSSLLPYIAFLSARGKRKYFIIDNENETLSLKHSIPWYYFPLMGTVRVRLVTINEFVTEKTAISYANKTINIPFPHIDQYHISQIQVFFNDSLSFFSWLGTIPMNAKWTHELFEETSTNPIITPSKTMDDVNRQEKIIVSPGEWLQQKAFEQGDDVRRIIWKIYAKNKTLQVKTQEPKSPYAQRVEIYIDWTTDIDLLSDRNKWSMKLADQYKSYVYHIITDTIASGFMVSVNANGMIYDDLNSIKQLITHSFWNNEKSNTNQQSSKSVIITHSLSSHEYLESLIDHPPSELLVCDLTNPLVAEKRNVIARIFINRDDEWQELRNRFTLNRLGTIIEEKAKLIADIQHR